MKFYLRNKLEKSQFLELITLIDYRIQISRCLKSIRISPHKKGKLLIDTLVCSGLNEYRFIEASIRKDGTINIDDYEYVIPEDNLKKLANSIIKSKPSYLKNSILSEKTIEIFLSTDIKSDIK